MYMIAEVSQYVAVASFSEAWIEIILVTEKLFKSLVASFSEAWIEINLGKNENEGEQVASFSEAWIEILIISTALLAGLMSPPFRRRGLKFEDYDSSTADGQSPPFRRRGLKYLAIYISFRC